MNKMGGALKKSIKEQVFSEEEKRLMRQAEEASNARVDAAADSSDREPSGHAPMRNGHIDGTIVEGISGKREESVRRVEIEEVEEVSFPSSGHQAIDLKAKRKQEAVDHYGWPAMDYHVDYGDTIAR